MHSFELGEGGEWLKLVKSGISEAGWADFFDDAIDGHIKHLVTSGGGIAGVELGELYYLLL